MKIFMAGGAGAKKREIGWLKVLKRRLLSFYEMLDKQDQHYHKGAFILIKKRYKENDETNF